MVDKKLLPCPFCGSADIDPEGVASFKKENRGGKFDWANYAPEMLEYDPACNNCSATASKDSWNTRAAFAELMSPCKFSVTNGDMINLIPKNGAVQRLAARQNAVCIQYFLTADDEGEYYRACVWVECQDMGMQEYLLQEARNIMAVLPRPTPIKNNGGKNNAKSS